ncbi:tetratricopeptide repeat protein [Thalassotalea mangrovi]|uniref:Tetratricopeptide repeat protein n=1 Tax=Thalassotalea mangrovi TaxID=2572245 RepID=A0A4U1B7X9_9GAMM|nr:tetratricopeptide repeat protein [Thalassotalea mangrovi]TKB46092.1 tetratricopeptide repeat protein [Thalassotalea mangrovi]
MNFTKPYMQNRNLRQGLLACLLPLVMFGCALSPEEEAALLAEQQRLEEEQRQAKLQEGRSEEYLRLIAMPNKYKQSAVQVQPPLSVEIKNAMAKVDGGAVSDGRKALEKISINHPNLSGIKLKLGDIALKDNNLKLAQVYYQQAISANSYNYFAHNRLGTVLRKLGKYAEAKEHYLAALDSWPAFAPAHHNLGILLDIYLGDKAGAINHYQTYQVLTDNKNRKVNGWIADSSAQLSALQKGNNNG